MTFIINTCVICLAKLIKEIFLSRPWLIKSNKFIAMFKTICEEYQNILFARSVYVI